MAQLSSKTVIEFCDGSQAAFEVIYREFSERVLRLARQIVQSEALAQDVVQEFFCEVWERREKFRHASSFENYIYIMARNMAIDARNAYITEQMKRAAHSARKREESQNNVDAHINISDYRRVVSEALTTISPQRKMIYEMSREQGLSRPEIAQKLDLAKQTVDNEMTLALKTIRHHLRHHHLMSWVALLSANFYL